MGKPYLSFAFDKHGCGSLLFVGADGEVVHSYDSRSGSVNVAVELVHCIEAGAWVMKDLPVATDEVGMFIEPGQGWKCRLYRPDGDGGLAYTHYLVHPDGGKGGTNGCIGIVGTDAHPLRDIITASLKQHGQLSVFVRGPV